MRAVLPSILQTRDEKLRGTPEQLTLFTFLEEPTEPTPQRIWCKHCHSNCGPGLKAWVLANREEEHREVEPGRCALMVRLGVTEPFYELTETPWLSGWSVPYPRPVGFRGLDQLDGARQ